MIVLLMKKEKKGMSWQRLIFQRDRLEIFFFQMAVRCLSRIGRLQKKGGPCFPIISKARTVFLKY